MLDFLPKILFALLIALFSFAVFLKFSGKLKDEYIKWGYGTTFMYALGVVELTAVVGLFTQYAQYAAWFLLALMGGAMFTLLRNGEPGKAFGPSIIGTLLLGSFLYFKSNGMI